MHQQRWAPSEVFSLHLSACPTQTKASNDWGNAPDGTVGPALGAGHTGAAQLHAGIYPV